MNRGYRSAASAHGAIGRPRRDRSPTARSAIPSAGVGGCASGWWGALRCAPMPITVVGSIAYDTVKTPFGRRERMLGGAAVHFALAASFFEDVRVVGPVGAVSYT